MLFKVRITVPDGDSLVGIRIRHQNAALNADIILVHVSRCHYIAMGELLLYMIIFYNHMQRQCVAMH